MNIFRIASLQDVDHITEITKFAGKGLTTIPKTKSDVTAYIDKTQRFLKGDKTANRILFVIEQDGQVQGISGIIPALGQNRPFYSFKKSSHTRKSKSLSLSVTHKTLQLSTEFDSYTELASIFLSPNARGAGLGRLLSLGRLGFIHRHRDLFSDWIMADIRGWADNDGQFPFWNGLTSKFISTSFEEADRLSNLDGDFIDVLIPSLPIMLNVLPPYVANCVGRPHVKSKGALRILTEVGFEATDFCDVFDGGPSIRAKFDMTLIGKTARPIDDYNPITPDASCLHFGGSRENFTATLGPNDAVMAQGFKADSKDHWVASVHEEKRPVKHNSELPLGNSHG